MNVLIKMESDHDVSKICRTCLNQQKLMYTIFEVKLSETYNVRVIDFIRRLTSIKMVKSDELPNNICMHCIHELCKAFDFAQMCITNDSKLKDWLNSTKVREVSQYFIEPGNTNYKTEMTDKLTKQTENEIIIIKNNCELEHNDETSHLSEVDASSNEKEYSREKKDENLNANHQCSICGKIFKKESQLKTHSRIHNKTREVFICNVCGQKFSYLYLLQKHSYKHQDNKPFPCTQCDKGCFTAESLRRHMKTHDADYVKKMHICSICSKEFRYPSFLAEHMKNHTGERPFLCSVCGKGFRQSGALQYHIRSHTGSRPYPCNICSKSFSSPGVLKIHMRRHTDERPYVCDICGMAFRQSTDMRTHRRTHTGEKPALCTICGKRFSSSSQLNIHIRTHTGEKPFLCSCCSKSFTTRDMLIKHERIHTGEKPYVCNICLKAFNQSSTLKTHLNTHKSTKTSVVVDQRTEENSIDAGGKVNVIVLPTSSMPILPNVKMA